MSEIKTFRYWNTKARLRSASDFVATILGCLLFLAFALWLPHSWSILKWIIYCTNFMAFLDAIRILVEPFIYRNQRIEIEQNKIRYYGRHKEPTIERDLVDIQRLVQTSILGMPHEYTVLFEDGADITFKAMVSNRKTLVAILESRTGKRFEAQSIRKSRPTTAKANQSMQ